MHQKEIHDDLQEQLTETSIATIRAFRILKDHPDDKGAKLNIRSLQKRLRVLLERQNKENEPTPGEESVAGLKELPGAVSTGKPRRTEKEIDDFVDLIRRT